MDLNISKAKLTKKGCLEVVYADKEGNDIVFKGINPVHPDLKDSLNKLIPYIVDITEQKESQYINWEEFRDAVYNFLYEAELYVTENKCSEIQRKFEFKDGEDPFDKVDEAADAMNEDGEDNGICSTVEHHELVLEPAS